MLISEDHGGAGLGAFDAMLVAQECGRVLAGVPLLGVLPATALLDAAGHERLEAIAAGEVRAAWLPARPPGDADEDPAGPSSVRGAWAASPRRRRRSTATRSRSRAASPGCPTPRAPRCSWSSASTGDGEPVAGAIDAAAASVEAVVRYDATRALGHVTLDGARGTRLDVGAEQIARAWYLAQALLAAESVGASEAALEMAVAYAKERFTFGRAIGSYQAIKHGLTEVLRLLENARSLLYYAGYAFADRPAEFPLAASAARSAAGRALDFAARQNITTHGGIGATWEHDAPLFFRRAQLSRPPARRDVRRDRPRRGRAARRRGRGGLRPPGQLLSEPPRRARRATGRSTERGT